MKILVIRFSSIGDIVLTSPVVRVLKQQLGAEVHFLCRQSFREVVAHNPHIDRLHTIQKRVHEILPVLRKERFDYIIDLHGNLRSWQVKWALWSVPSRTFDKLNFRKWLLTTCKINLMPAVHIVDRYLATVAGLGLTADGKGLDYFVGEQDAVDPASLSPLLAENRFTAVVVGAAHATKRLPEDRLAALCDRLDGLVVLLGGPSDQAVGERIAAAVGSRVINACGKLRLNQSADLLRQADRVITHDTGLMHIAAAYAKPIVSIWGNTTPALGMYPYVPEGQTENRILEVSGLACRPCSKIGYDACPKGHFRCMRDISFEGL
jgi:ADP-heptose:LPS heptosyltransferase